MSMKEIWSKLSSIDCSRHVEKKMGLSYLSWAWAWGVLMEHYPEATFEFEESQSQPDGTMMVFCTISIGEASRRMWLPVMDYKNKAIINPDSFAINTANMRCLVKCMALFGLGLYIYAGEDVPLFVEPEKKASPDPMEAQIKVLQPTPAQIKVLQPTPAQIKAVASASNLDELRAVYKGMTDEARDICAEIINTAKERLQ